MADTLPLCITDDTHWKAVEGMFAAPALDYTLSEQCFSHI